MLERDKYRSSHYAMLKKNAVEKGIKDLHFVDGLKNGFIASIILTNKFEPREIDGQVVFLNSNNKTIPEVLKEFSTTAEM